MTTIAPEKVQVEKGWIGESVPRKEDKRLTQGEGVFVDDVKRHGMGYLHFVRSPYAHAHIVSHFREARSLIAYAAPISIYQLINAFMARLDLLMLGYFVGRAPGVTLATVGIYSAVIGTANGLRKVNQAFKLTSIMPVQRALRQTRRQAFIQDAFLIHHIVIVVILTKFPLPEGGGRQLFRVANNHRLATAGNR